MTIYDYKRNGQMPLMSLFEIIASTRNADKVMLACFGNTWPKQLPAGFMHTLNSLTMAIPALKEDEQQYDYIFHHISYMQNIPNVASIGSYTIKLMLDNFSAQSRRQLLLNYKMNMPAIFNEWGKILFSDFIQNKQYSEILAYIKHNPMLIEAFLVPLCAEKNNSELLRLCNQQMPQSSIVLEMLLLCGSDKQLLIEVFGEDWNHAITDAVLKNCVKRIKSKQDFANLLSLLSSEHTQQVCMDAHDAVIQLLDASDYLKHPSMAAQYVYTLLKCGSSSEQFHIIGTVFEEKIREKIATADDMIQLLSWCNVKMFTSLYQLWKDKYPELFTPLFVPLLMSGSLKKDLLIIIYGEDWQKQINTQMLVDCANNCMTPNSFEAVLELLTLEQSKIFLNAFKDKLLAVVDNCYGKQFSGAEKILMLLGPLKPQQCALACIIFKDQLQKIMGHVTEEQLVKLKESSKSTLYQNSWESISSFICAGSNESCSTNTMLSSGEHHPADQTTHSNQNGIPTDQNGLGFG